jgi:thioredoxin-related protein
MQNGSAFPRFSRRAALVALAALALVLPAFAQDARVEPAVMDDGRYTQPWFLTSFLDLKDDLAESAAHGKRLAIVWDQRGCPYCQEMHRVNLADPAVNAYIRERFNVVQLDLFGSREVTDFDGETMAEKDLARKYGVIGSPTIQFLPPAPADLDGKRGRAVEVARMPGYFRPGHFEAMFAFVYDRAYETESFARFFKERAQPRPADKLGGKS